MRKKKAEVDVTKQTLAAADQGVMLEPKHHATPAPASSPATTEGVIDLDPATDQQSATYARQNPPTPTAAASTAQAEPKAKRKYTKRAKATTTSVVKPLADSDRIYEKAVGIFRAYFNDEITQQAFEGRIADLKLFQTLATKLNDSEYDGATLK